MRTAVWVAMLSGCLLLVLRWFYARSYLWNSDEPQHLHVVWAWASGLLPYRDVFDNHTPLFHILSVPLFRALGERADIVWAMRLAMIPLFALSLWCIYLIGRNVFSPRAGIWSAVLLGFFQPYFFMMGQYRTDVLWTVLWLGSLVVLTGGTLTNRRLFFTGLLVGAAFGVSMKTTLLLIVLSLAGVLTWIVWRAWVPRSAVERATLGEILSAAAAALAGLLLIPLLILGFFAMKGALGPLYYCVIEHNTLPGEHTWTKLLGRLVSWGWLTLLPAAALVLTVRPSFATVPHRAIRQVFFIVCAGLFYPVLHGFWRMITQQDYVPWFPLLAVVIAPQLLLVEKYVRRWGSTLAHTALLLMVAGELHWLLRHAPIFGSGSTDWLATIAETLRLTDRGEYVMDPKGDLIYRPRPYYYVLESLTKKRLASGLLKDELPERLVETRTAVIRFLPERMTERSIGFVRANYLPVGHLAVLGLRISAKENDVTSFELVIPERYSVVGKAGALVGTLDGETLDGPRWLAAGHHELRVTSPAPDAVLVWSRALERGFSPFTPSIEARE